MEAGGDPLLGLQYCGEGKVRCIIPLSPQKMITASLQVSGVRERGKDGDREREVYIHVLIFVQCHPIPGDLQSRVSR